MIKNKITFLNMPHSPVIEEHSQGKLDKFLHIIHQEGHQTPLYAELWLKANKVHPHHSVELHLKTPHLDLHTEAEGPDMYLTIDSAIDKMMLLVKKSKEKQRDKERKHPTEKSSFER